MVRGTFFISLCFILFLSCKKETPNVDMGYAYFPTEEGRFVLYEVMEVRHDTDLIPTHDTSRYYVKEVVGELFIDETQQEAHKLKRYIGNHPDSLYLQDVWTIKRTTTNAQKVEENIRIVKLGFAPNITSEWDGNAFNNEDELIYTYDWIGEGYTIGQLSTNDNVKVLQQDYYTFVDYLSAYEVYSRDIGLIHKVEKEFYISNFDTINIIRGEEIEMKAIDYGVESN